MTGEQHEDPFAGVPDPDEWSQYGVGEERILEPTINGQDQAPRPRLRPWTWAELEALPEPEYLVKGILDAGCMSVVYGASGSDKTFLAVDLALHIALGRPWRNRRTRQGQVIYMAAEAGRSIKKRLRAMKAHHHLVEDPPTPIIPVTVDLCTDHADAEAIAAEVDALGGALLVVVDTLSAAMANGNENLPDDMGAFVANIALLRERTGAHVLVVHHSGKDTAKGARGHTKLRAATDTEIEVTDDEGMRTAKVTTQRDGIAGETFAFTLQSVEVGTNDEGHAVTSCVVVAAEQEAIKSRRAKVTGQAKIVLDLLHRAVGEAGEAPPSGIGNRVPQNGTFRVVPLTLFRRYVYDGLASDRDKRDSQGRAFNRNTNKLQSLGLMGSWGDYVWPTGQAGQAGT